MLGEILLGLGVLVGVSILLTFVLPMVAPQLAGGARFLIFAVLTWLIGSLWLGLSFELLVVVYVILLVVLWMMPGGKR